MGWDGELGGLRWGGEEIERAKFHGKSKRIGDRKGASNRVKARNRGKG